MVISLRLNNEQLLKISPIAKKNNKSIPVWVRDAALKAAENINSNNGIVTGVLNENDFFQIREILSEELEPLKNNSINNFIEEIKIPVEPVEPVKDWADYEIEISELKSKVSELDKENEQLAKTIDSLEDDLIKHEEYQNLTLLDFVNMELNEDEQSELKNLIESACNSDKNKKELCQIDLLVNVIKNGMKVTKLDDGWNGWGTQTEYKIYR